MTIERFLIAVESIAASLATIASTNGTATAPVVAAAPVAAAEGKETKPRAARTTKADTKPADSAPAAAAAAPADPTPEPAKPETPTFDYEELKKAIIALASAGDAGKEAATRILTDAGLSRGQKAIEAPASKWPSMHKQAVDALAALNAGGEFA